MDRTRFFKITTVNGVKEFDFLDNNLSKLELKRQVGYVRVSSADIMRPDMMSYKNYSTPFYWWIILLVNHIGDPFLEMNMGDMYQLPNLLDLYDFFKDDRIR